MALKGSSVATVSVEAVVAFTGADDVPSGAAVDPEHSAEEETGGCVNHTMNVCASEDSDWSQKKDLKPKMSKKVKRYYKSQNELLESIEDIQLRMEEYRGDDTEETRNRTASLLAKITFAINFILFCGKAVAAALSGSLSVISSVLDSAVDLVSGVLMWYSNRAIKHVNYYLYPRGRRKLEPVTIVILAVIMSLASVQVIQSSVEKIVTYTDYDVNCHVDKLTNQSEELCGTYKNLTDLFTPCVSGGSGPLVELPTILICCITIGTKLALFLICRRIDNPTVQALALDHRNDVVSNSSAIAFGLIGYHLWKYIDPIGAILIGFYIIVNWFRTAYEQIKMITGYTASPDYLKKVTWIILNHSPKILFVDDLKAFHFGTKYLVEADIVLADDMGIQESHDIGETLQLKLEKLEDVERAFVHVDYECGYRHHTAL